MTTAGIHHVAMASSDLDRSLAFYRDVLGLRPAPGEAAPEQGGVPRLVLGDEAGRPGTLLTLLEASRPEPGRPGIGGVHHTALGVADEGGLLKWKRRLTDLGSGVSGPYDRGYFTSLYFRDPDGHILEIATAGPGYTIDEPADRLGGQLMVPPQRIVRGHRDEAAIAALTHPDPVPEVSGDMRLQGIHHVSAITDDLERAGAFYEAALGLRLVKKTTNRDDPSQLHYFWASLRGGEVAPHSAFTLFGWPSTWNQVREGVGQACHVAFRARDDEELLAWANHIRSLGVEVSPVEERAHSRSVSFRAPDGLRLAVATDGPAYTAEGGAEALRPPAPPSEPATPL